MRRIGYSRRGLWFWLGVVGQVVKWSGGKIDMQIDGLEEMGRFDGYWMNEYTGIEDTHVWYAIIILFGAYWLCYACLFTVCACVYVGMREKL